MNSIQIDLDEAVADRIVALASEQTPDDVRFKELLSLIEASIAKSGRGTEELPSTTSALEERVNLPGLSNREKIEQCRDIIEFLRYCDKVLRGIAAEMPDILVRASKRAPASAVAIFGPHLAKRN